MIFNHFHYFYDYFSLFCKWNNFFSLFLSLFCNIIAFLFHYFSLLSFVFLISLVPDSWLMRIFIAYQTPCGLLMQEVQFWAIICSISLAPPRGWGRFRGEGGLLRWGGLGSECLRCEDWKRLLSLQSPNEGAILLMEHSREAAARERAAESKRFFSYHIWYHRYYSNSISYDIMVGIVISWY